MVEGQAAHVLSLRIRLWVQPEVLEAVAARDIMPLLRSVAYQQNRNINILTGSRSGITEESVPTSQVQVLRISTFRAQAVAQDI
jgi:hypothetical protein